MKKMISDLLSRTGDVALRRRAAWILGRVRLQTGSRVLDIGCGDGFYIHLLSRLFPKVRIVGLDNDPKALKSARANLEGSGVTLQLGDINNIPLKDNQFDVVILSEVLEHLDNDRQGLKEVHRVLKPRSQVFISVPHANYPFFWDPINWTLEKFFDNHIKDGFWAGIWNQHKRLYNHKELRSLMMEVGFKKIKIESLTHYCLPFNHHLLNAFARIMVNHKYHHNPLNKFNKDSRSNINYRNPFWLIFKIDKLNDSWNKKGGAVSIVATAIK